MSVVNFIMLPNSVTVSFDGKLVTIMEKDHRYEQTIEAIKSGDLDKIPAIVDVKRSFEDLEGVEYTNGRVKLNGQDIPDCVSDRVLSFKAQGLPFTPLIKFSEKLMSNVSFNSRKMLYKFLEHNGHPITKEGNFIAYKKVNREFKDCYTNSIDNSLGTTVKMDRNLVDDNPDNTCSSGLHVAAYNFAKGFSNGHLVEVEINPEHVVAVPNDYDGEKMRVCEYKVVKVCESRLDDVELYDDDDDNEEYGEFGFEVGDYIEILDRDNIEGSEDLIEGDIYEVNNVCSEGDIYIKDGVGCNLPIFLSEFEYIRKVLK